VISFRSECKVGSVRLDRIEKEGWPVVKVHGEYGNWLMRYPACSQAVNSTFLQQ